MAKDFVHTTEIIDAVIAVLKGDDGSSHTGGLPANWFEDGDDGDEVLLKLLEHGDVTDYSGADDLERDLPAILVRGLGPEPGTGAGTGGVQETMERVRVIHVRGHDQCRDDDGDREHNMTRARGRYAKVIGKALFNDPHRKLATIDSGGDRTEVTLSCDDGAGAQVFDVQWDGWDMGQEPGGPGSLEEVRAIRAMPARIWAIGCELRVMIRTGGAS